MFAHDAVQAIWERRNVFLPIIIIALTVIIVPDAIR